MKFYMISEVMPLSGLSLLFIDDMLGNTHQYKEDNPIPE
jgi:hypothetical protein